MNMSPMLSMADESTPSEPVKIAMTNLVTERNIPVPRDSWAVLIFFVSFIVFSLLRLLLFSSN